MALTTTATDIQVVIGAGLPTAGEISQGGIVLSLSNDGTQLVGLGTSTDGTDIVLLDLGDGNANTLAGQTLSQVIATAVQQAKDDLTNGASGAYDTLKELQTALEEDDVDIAAILNTQANKVDKVSGKSLILDTEITRLADVENTALSDSLTSTSTTIALNLKGAKDLKAAIDNIPVSRVQTY